MSHASVDCPRDHEQLHEVLRLMAVGVLLVDTDGRIEYANSAALRGRESADVVGQLAADPAWKLTDQYGQLLPYDALPVPTVLREKRAVRDVQLGAINLDGSLRWMLVTAMPRADANGASLGAVVTVEDVTGSGLGLSICYGAIKQARGELTVKSDVGRGSTFRVYLPRVDAAPVGAAEAAHVRSASPQTLSGNGGGRRRVLLVEDDHALRGLIVRVLQKYGYDVRLARGGEEAVALHAQLDHPVDLLITDIVMPGMRGTDVARELRAAAPQLRVLFVTGYAEPSVLEGLEREDAPAARPQFLLKPFTPAQLIARVSAMLET